MICRKKLFKKFQEIQFSLYIAVYLSLSCEDGEEDDQVGDQCPDADASQDADLLYLEHVLDEGGEGGPHRVPGLGVHHLRAVVEADKVPEAVLVGPVLALTQTLHCLICRTLSDVLQHKAGALVIHF